MDRRPYSEWEEKKDGGRDRATARPQKIRAEQCPEPLDPQISVELEKIIKLVEKLIWFL